MLLWTVRGMCIFRFCFYQVYTQEWDCWVSFFKNLHTVFHSGCTNVYSYQQCTRFPFFYESLPAFINNGLWIIAILTGMKWYLIVVLSWISWWLMMPSIFSWKILICDSWIWGMVLNTETASSQDARFEEMTHPFFFWPGFKTLSVSVTPPSYSWPLSLAWTLSHFIGLSHTWSAPKCLYIE